MQMPEPELIDHAGLGLCCLLEDLLDRILDPFGNGICLLPLDMLRVKKGVVYNANKLSELVHEKKKMRNWLDYYQLKYSRNQSKKPLLKSLANIEGIEKAVPFLKSIIEMKAIKSFIQGFLPGIALKIFLIFLPSILMLMSKFEGFISLSGLERRSATRYYIFQFINVFLGSIITGTAFQQLNNFIHQSANNIPKTIGASIPMKATFFITYIMVDGWAGVAGEILRLKPLIIYHLKNFFLVKTEKDREEAMDPGTIGFNTGEPQIQLYFLLGLVYAVIINVYNQEYESAAAFWPDVHGRIVVALVVSQLLLMGLLSTKHAAQSTPLLVTLPVLTIWFHRFCKGRYEPAFIRYPLQEAMMKDTLERAREPNLNLKSFLQNAYIHPVFKGGDDSDYAKLQRGGERTCVGPNEAPVSKEHTIG
ncbi:hypothetical protein GH714_032291 [Hevea brasiliensis]|uniref:CSC1/OSCA1-like 7TM region domain-containing protein n=1 Tax=Hevea brasiliensis TaxID=3981 RepID=A0A6A6K940_HEVBR|nr:hypothetical protein GH714_032291 [Hevea brasiliensis]